MEPFSPYLVERIAEHDDEKAFGELFENFFPGLFSFANSIIKDRQKSEEIVADVFFNIWEINKNLLLSGKTEKRPS